jgi:two-component system cell cycle response regulator
MNARILVIEDNPPNLELMTYLLGFHGYAVRTASDGASGVELAQRELPDLIICDVHLPKLDGYEVARALKQSPMLALRSTPLLAVTALAMVGDREKVLAAGFDGYIAKPIDPETFVQQAQGFVPAGLRAPPRADEPPTVESAAPHGPAKRAVLLVVDDLDAELRLMHSLFESFGLEVLAAFNVAQALTIAKCQRCDLIVGDVNMAGGTGYELLERMNADPQLCRIPVLLSSAWFLSGRDRQRGFNHGAVRYLTRPIEPQALLAEIEACLAEGRPT